DAVILPVGDIHPVFSIAGDVVRDIKLPWPDARLAPREQQATIGGVFVYPGVAVAIGDVDIVRERRQRHMRGAVKGDTAKALGGLIGRANGKQELALWSELADGVVTIISAVDGVVRANMDGVGAA